MTKKTSPGIRFIEWLLTQAAVVGLCFTCLVLGLAVGYVVGKHEAVVIKAALMQLDPVCGSCRRRAPASNE